MFFRNEDSYSEFIRWAKVLLPLSALVLLSTLFLFSGKVEVTDALIYADIDVDEIVREQRISDPYFSTVTDAGVGVVVTAGFANPAQDRPDVVVASNVTAQLTPEGGDVVVISAGSAEIDGAAQVFTLTTDVVVTGAEGVTVNAQRIIADMDRSTVVSPDPITAHSPFGSINAGGMTVQGLADDMEWLFTDGVQVVYQRNN